MSAKQKVSKVIGIILVVAAVLITLITLLGVFLMILPGLGRTYYPLNYYFSLVGVLSITIGMWLTAVWCLKFSKGTGKLGLLIAGIILIAVYFLYRFPFCDASEKLIAQGKGYKAVKEVTYSVNDFQYKLPAAWTKDSLHTNDGWEERSHYPFTKFSGTSGFVYVYGMDHEFTDNDYTGDYRSFMNSWYSDCENYKIVSTEYKLNEKYNIAAQIQESYSTYEDMEFFDLTYLVEDRENGKFYLIQYRKYDYISEEDYANFDVIIDHLP